MCLSWRRFSFCWGPAAPWPGLAFIGAAMRWQQLDGQAFVIFIMAVAASEVAVGLALIVYSQRRTGNLNADRYDLMKG